VATFLTCIHRYELLDGAICGASTATVVVESWKTEMNPRSWS